ncbi:MAG: aspartate kinase [Clostridiales bacterium]|nr:aspartate kinase [Clostridiales bacterium]
MLKVVKFGGSSLADAEQFKKVGDIIRNDASRRYVVASAPGKRNAQDTKVTDMLYQCYALAAKGQDIDESFREIEDRFNGIIAGLGLDFSLEKEFELIKNGFIHKAGKDYAASRGEYLNAMILAKYLGFDFIDAADVILFEENGRLNMEGTNTLLASVLADHPQAVIPGFYGSMPNDTIKTFSRGGSDVTGSIVARAVQADLYENWTDVSGFLMADPRIIENPLGIELITYAELRELSFMGAGVLHEEAIFPVRFAEIPINIKNTNRPDDSGTMIVPAADKVDLKHVITGLAGKRGFSVLSIEKDMMNAEIGFGKRVLEVLEKHSISFEHLPSGVDTMSVIIATQEIAEIKDQIKAEVCRAVSPDKIAIDDGLALLAIVGRGMVQSKGTAARIFNAVAGADINIRMIDQGSSEKSIIMGVEESDLENAMRAIYKEFVH